MSRKERKEKRIEKVIAVSKTMMQHFTRKMQEDQENGIPFSCTWNKFIQWTNQNYVIPHPQEKGIYEDAITEVRKAVAMVIEANFRKD